MKVQVNIQHGASGSYANITNPHFDLSVWLPPKASKEEAIFALGQEALAERCQAKVHLTRAARIEAAVKALEES